MRQIKALLEQEKEGLAFSKEDERTWGEWVNFKQREFRDLRELLTGNYQDNFKRRALFAILVPDHQWIPFKWKFNMGSSESYLFLRCVELKGLPVHLLEYAAGLVCKFTQLLRDNPRCIDKPENALFTYNDYLLQLLSLLPDGQMKEAVFQNFSVNDATPYQNMDFASGYNPFGALIRSETISEGWKKRADMQMREIIRAEQEGRATPRVEHEDAFRCYASILQLQLYSEDGLPYSTEFFADQINFIVSMPNTGRDGIIDSWHVEKLLALFSGSELRDLRHRISRFVVFNNGEPLKAYSSETLSAAEKMSDEFGADDAELQNRLESILAEGRTHIQENREAQGQQKSAEDAILARMAI